MEPANQGERGQALVEFALILIILLTLIIGTVDVGRGFFQYNEMASAARYAARWGSVVGGTCNGNTDGQIAPSTANDWCNQNQFSSPPAVSGACVTPDSTSMNGFWTYNGNYPLQCGATAATRNCPTSYNPNYQGYYQVSNFFTTTATSIVGAVANHFDTNSSGSYYGGTRTAGFDASLLQVCIQLPWDSTNGRWMARIGDPVRIFVYYTFHPATTWLAKVDFHLIASASYPIE